MKITILDDYQEIFGDFPAIDRLRQKAEVRIYTKNFGSQEALIRALNDSQVIIPIRERTQFQASLLRSLQNLKKTAQTENKFYHTNFPAATEAGILVTTAP